MADYDNRWRNEGRASRGDRFQRHGREDFGHRDQQDESGFGGGFGAGEYRPRNAQRQQRNPGYGYEGYGREGYDYGREYWRHPEETRGSERSWSDRDVSSDFGRDRDYGGSGRRSYGGGNFGAASDRDLGHGVSGHDMGRYRTGGSEMSSGMPGGGMHRGRGPHGYARSDERIREDINDRLTDDPYIDASDIDVTVSNGEVTLSGTVDHRMTRRRAEDLVEMIPGVTHVQNNLRTGQQAGNAGGSATSAGASAMAGLGTSDSNTTASNTGSPQSAGTTTRR